MPGPIGPTIPRWQLGGQLSRLRERARVTQAQVAEALGCSISKIQKIEAGDVGVVRAELLLVLDLFGVTEPTVRDELTELQRLGRQRGWWAKLGEVPGPFATFLGLESAATSIQIFEPMMIPGLLQTEEYARAIAATCDVEMSGEQVERQVRIRTERQERILTPDGPQLSVVLDEAVLRRAVGGPDVMAQQLRHLAAMARRHTIQVVPFGRGGYPGVRGALTILEFDERMHTSVVYVESQVGNLYQEQGGDLRRRSPGAVRAVNLGEPTGRPVFTHVAAAALSLPESVKLINAVAREHAEAAGS